MLSFLGVRAWQHSADGAIYRHVQHHPRREGCGDVRVVSVCATAGHPT